MARILIVDDSPTETHVMQKALEKGGFRTAVAADGQEGIRLAREMHPDLIFMDIVMPGMNGFQATRALVNDPDTSAIPIVMVTSKNQETYREQAARHDDPGKQAQASRREWNEDTRDKPTIEDSPRARDSDIGSGKSGSESNESSGTRGH